MIRIDVVMVSVSGDEIETFARPDPVATWVAIEADVIVVPFSSIETEQKSHPTATEITSPTETDSEKS